jgi:hypothetical protein
MGAPSNPDLQAKRRVDYEEWFLREVDQGLAAEAITCAAGIPVSRASAVLIEEGLQSH